MNRQDMLAGLMRQAANDEGDLVTLRAIVEEASEIGADRAMTRLGLDDIKARDDIDELRELLGAWRDAKSSAVKSAMAWLMRGFLALLLIGIAVRIGVPEMLR